jgi:hypothetical protein
MPRLVIQVDQKAYQRLVAREVDARRDARDEAALIVERVLRKAAPPPRPETACDGRAPEPGRAR